MTQLIKEKKASIIFNADDTKAIVKKRNNEQTYLYDFNLATKIKIDVLGLGIFSVAFSKENDYVTLLLYDKKTCDLEKLLIVNCKTGEAVKTVSIKDYVQDDVGLIAPIHNSKNYIVVSLQKSNASGAVLLVVDLNNNFSVCVKDFHKTIIKTVHCIEDKLLVLSMKGLLYLFDCPNLQIQDEFLYDKGILCSVQMYDCCGKIQIYSFIHPNLMPYRKYMVSEFDVLSGKIKQISKYTKRQRKMPEPDQYLFDKGCILATKRKFIKPKRVFGAYKIENLDFIGEFLINDNSVSFINGEKTVEILTSDDINPSSNEKILSYDLSNTGKYSVVYTNKFTYVLENKDQSD